MVYYVVYVERCCPKIKLFKTKKALTLFLDKFHDDIDNWIDYVFHGKRLK